MQANDEFIDEILKYYELVKINNIQNSFYELSCEDDDSFIYPSYNEIVSFVDSSKKYEDYFGKIKKSLDEFNAYVAKHSNFLRVYKFTIFNKYTKISNKFVNKFLEIFETKQNKLNLNSFFTNKFMLKHIPFGLKSCINTDILKVLELKIIGVKEERLLLIQFSGLFCLRSL